MPNTYDIGDVVRLTASFTSSGSAIDPTTVVARVQTSSNVITVYTYGVDNALLKDAIGTYHIDVTPLHAGLFTYRFEGSGNVYSATESTFNVRLSAFYS